MPEISDEIKAVMAADIPDGAKLAILAAWAGAKTAKEVGDLCNMGLRSAERHTTTARDYLRKFAYSATSELRKSAEVRKIAEEEVRKSAEEDTQICVETPRVCDRAPARLETPSGLLSTLEVKTNPPNPQGGTGMTFADPHLSDGVVEQPDGRLQLVNGTKAFWLERFGGDERRLEFALIEAAGQRQPNTRQPLRKQVERTLARIAGQKHDGDQRYQSAVKSRPASGAPVPIKIAMPKRDPAADRAAKERAAAFEADWRRQLEEMGT